MSAVSPLSPLSENKQAIIEFTLPNRVTAEELGVILSSLNIIYYNRLFIDYVKKHPDQPFVYAYRPEEDDVLIISWLSIGTPNKLALKGRAAQIAAVVAVVASLLGQAQVASETYKDFQEAQKFQLEIDREPLIKEKMELEIVKLRIEVIKGLDELKKQGLITEEQYEQLKSQEEHAVDSLALRRHLMEINRIITEASPDKKSPPAMKRPPVPSRGSSASPPPATGSSDDRA